jgi:hypothetical protein
MSKYQNTLKNLAHHFYNQYQEIDKMKKKKMNLIII